MKCIVFVAFLAVCSAYPYQTGYNSGYGSGYGVDNIYNLEKWYKINSDGSMTVHTSTGTKITISKDVTNNNVEIVVDKSVSGKKDHQKTQYSEADFLAEILVKYEGDVSPSSYQKLLQEVSYEVQIGKINYPVYQYLQKLNPSQYLTEQGHMMQPYQQTYPMRQFTKRMTFQYPQYSQTTSMGGKWPVNSMFYGNTNWQNTLPYFMYNKLGQQYGTYGQPGQLFEGESELLNQPLHTQMLNEQVLDQQHQLQNGEQYTYGNLYNVGTPFNQMAQYGSFWPSYPKVYTQGLYGGYGQGTPQFYNNLPMVPMVV